MLDKYLRASTLALIALFSLVFVATAQEAGPNAAAEPTSPSTFTNINIKNFGQMDEHYYRGAQPLPEDYKALADLGINTIVDLRNDPTDYERSAAEAVGIKYISLPMSGWKTPKDTDIARFLEIANDPATGTMYVHCKAGIHRTGITAAIYRMEKYGWDYDSAYKEMKNYDWSSGLVHGALGRYVKRYAAKLSDAREATAAAHKAAAGTSTASASLAPGI